MELHGPAWVLRTSVAKEFLFDFSRELFTERTWMLLKCSWTWLDTKIVFKKKQLTKWLHEWLIFSAHKVASMIGSFVQHRGCFIIIFYRNIHSFHQCYPDQANPAALHILPKSSYSQTPIFTPKSSKFQHASTHSSTLSCSWCPNHLKQPCFTISALNTLRDYNSTMNFLSFSDTPHTHLTMVQSSLSRLPPFITPDPSLKCLSYVFNCTVYVEELSSSSSSPFYFGNVNFSTLLLLLVSDVFPY